ncbi:MAG: hypothetical protein HRU19_02980 [Pseudobacteriovorax sp.]|nr:hypothetical protein [Pseudobacteriovorax sp.]
MTTLSPLVEELKVHLSRYLSVHKSRSLSGVARKSGVSYSTVRRIQNGDCGEPHFTDTVIPIASVVFEGEWDQLYSFLRKHNKSAALSQFIENSSLKPILASDPKIEWCRVAVLIEAMASISGGIQISSIEKKFGDVGVSIGRTLVKLGYLEELSNVFTASLKFDQNHVATAARAKALWNSYTPQNKQSDSGHFFIAQAYTPGGAKEFDTLLDNFLRGLSELTERDKNKDQNKNVIRLMALLKENINEL